jgi:HAD superfamily hydrolase (TIGR01484 family)
MTVPLDRGQSAAPWAEAPRAALAGVRGILTDIDDTLTRDGALEPAARDALPALAAAGVPVLAVTGRPLGWSEAFLRAGPARWPLPAIVAENGAVALIAGPDAPRIEYAQDAATRARNAHRLREVAARVLAEVPGATLARDSAGRATDIAIDHSEFAHLDADAVARVVALMESEGLTATVSSIHVNGWFGTHSKWSGACWIVERLYRRDLRAELAHWLYVGDSTNDQEMFERFTLSVGVANLRRFAAELHSWPRWITEGERGAGFAEVAAAVLAARR